MLGVSEWDWEVGMNRPLLSLPLGLLLPAVPGAVMQQISHPPSQPLQPASLPARLLAPSFSGFLFKLLPWALHEHLPCYLAGMEYILKESTWRNNLFQMSQRGHKTWQDT